MTSCTVYQHIVNRLSYGKELLKGWLPSDINFIPLRKNVKLNKAYTLNPHALFQQPFRKSSLHTANKPMWCTQPCVKYLAVLSSPQTLRLFHPVIWRSYIRVPRNTLQSKLQCSQLRIGGRTADEITRSLLLLRNKLCVTCSDVCCFINPLCET